MAGDDAVAGDLLLAHAEVAAPAVVSLNGAAASLTMMRFLEWAVADEPSAPGQWVYRSYAGDVRQIAATRRDDCPVCSEGGRLGRKQCGCEPESEVHRQSAKASRRGLMDETVARMREETRKRIGTVEVAVELVREFRDR